MNGAFHIGATGLQAQQRALDVVAANISNINTSGYKRSVVRFSEMVAPSATTLPIDSGDLTVAQMQMMPAGVLSRGEARSWTPGEVRPTGQDMDIAIEGDGFIELLGPQGRTLLWRGGTLSINADGYLVTATGWPLSPMISVPVGASDLRVDPDGTVTTMAASGGERETLGRIDIVTVADTEALNARGNQMYEPIDGAELVATADSAQGARLVQGALEASNVSLTDEMVSLLLMQRAFGASAQVVQAGDQLMSIINTLRR